MSDRVLRINQVIEKTGLSRSTIYELMKAGAFPRSFKLAARSAGWLESQVDEWVNDRWRQTQAGK